MSLAAAVIVDVLVVVACLTAVVMRGGLRHSHPAVLYLTFHVLVVTARGIVLVLGSPPLLSGVMGFTPPGPDELARAVNYADVALVAATAGWILARRSEPAPAPAAPTQSPDTVLRSFDRLLPIVLLLVMPIGLVSLLGQARVFDDGSGVREQAFLGPALAWPGVILLLLIYRYGFRWFLIAPMGMYLVIVALQGSARFRFLLAVILLCQLSLDRRGRKWPGPAMSAALLAALLLFFPMKAIADTVVSGGGLEAAVSTAWDATAETLHGVDSDQAMLDELALTIALADDANYTTWGEQYAGAAAVLVPRALWPGKPGLADHLSDISTPDRPLNRLGAATTLAGDLYLSFRLIGIALIVFLLARWSMVMYQRAYASGYFTPRRLAYLVGASLTIQFLRDGLASIPIFVFVPYLPVTVVVVAWWYATRRNTQPAGYLPPLQDRRLAPKNAGVS
jgi:hypothetical protein